MKKICVILTVLMCAIVFVACNKTTDEKQNSAPDNMALTIEERKDIFVSYFNHCTEYSATDIEQNLDKIENLRVLTLDEALCVFWSESGVSADDYLHKTDAGGQVYYQQKKGDNKIAVFVNLLYKDMEENNIEVTNPENYGFIVTQTTGDNYLITIIGEVTVIQ